MSRGSDPLSELIKNQSLRFYEYLNENLDGLIDGCMVGELTFKKPTKEHCATMRRVMNCHIIHLAESGQSMHEIIDFLISLVSVGQPDSRDDLFNLFNIRSISLLLSNMANVRYMIHSLDAYSDHNGENLIVSLIKHVDRNCTKITVQALDACVILIHCGVTHILSSMSSQTTADGRVLPGLMYPNRVFQCYNWLATWTYSKYSGNTATSCSGPKFWMKPYIYDLSAAIINCKGVTDDIGINKVVRTKIIRVLEYYFKPTHLHISSVVSPHLTYYSQWRFNNRLASQLRQLLLTMVSNSSYIKKANDIVVRHCVKYIGEHAIATSISPVNVSHSGQRQRQASVPTTMSLNIEGDTSSVDTSVDMALSTGGIDKIQLSHKKTMIIVDGRNLFYKPDYPITHNIDLVAMREFLCDSGQHSLYHLIGRFILARFGVIIAEHEYAQFQTVVIFHDRHRKVMESCFAADPITGARGPPQRSNITYVYTPHDMNDDIIAMYMWLSNPGSILMTNDQYKNYIDNIPETNNYLRTLIVEWQRLFRITQREYYSMHELAYKE